MLPFLVAIAVGTLVTGAGSPSPPGDVALASVDRAGPERAPGRLDPVPSHPRVSALGKPPDNVFLQTQTFGTVSVPHAVHLKRRVSCARCHDPGPVGKIAFTARIAHDRCVGCHREQNEGPTSCTVCHVKAPGQPASVARAEAPPPEPKEPEPRAAAAAPAAAPAAAEEAQGAASEPLSERLEAGESVPSKIEFREVTKPAPPAELPEPPLPPLAAETVLPDQASPRDFEFALVGSGGLGASARVTNRYGPWVLAYGVDRLITPPSTRFLMVADLGMLVPLRGRWGLAATWFAGLDTQDAPNVAASGALGIRARLEWHAPPSAQRPAVCYHLGVAAYHDFPPRMLGPQLAPTRVYVTLGFSLGYEYIGALLSGRRR